MNQSQARGAEPEGGGDEKVVGSNPGEGSRECARTLLSKVPICLPVIGSSTLPMTAKGLKD